MARSKLSRKSKRSRNSKNSDEPKVETIDFKSIENDKLAVLQTTVNQHMYDIITAMYSELEQNAESKDAIGIIISAVSTNLGMILAQIPEHARETYITLASTIVQKSLIASIEAIAEQSHGQIGHA